MTELEPRPSGVTAIAVAFLSAAAYLLGVGLIMLVRPGTVSMAAGAALLGGLERRVAILVAGIGVLLLLPSVSSAVVDFRIGKLAWGGLGMIVRVVIVWYLHQEETREFFAAR